MANPQAVAAVVPFPVPAPDAVSPPGNGKFDKALCQGDKSVLVKFELEETSDSGGDAAKRRVQPEAGQRQNFLHASI